MGWTWPDADQTIVLKNYTPPDVETGTFIKLSRDVSSEEVEAQKLDVMPGFRFSWWYTGLKIPPDNTFKDDELNKYFVR